ncbi:hypothetical protein EYF80_013481 [Liparis tanakae]|uniref:Uncharacterized protein n=1 Tax=Liparis tanakae TaxID=230148 RepID=A0A4Z2IGD4_9TELE|nr:hypothetical protein EYF80_013481 [Liparis tanakae]
MLLTSELQPPQLEGDQAVADLHDVHQSVEVVGGEDEAVARGVVAPAAEQQVSTQAVLQRAQFDRSGVGRDEHGAAEDGIERRGEDGREDGLNEEHGGVWSTRVKDSSIGVDSRASVVRELSTTAG